MIKIVNNFIFKKNMLYNKIKQFLFVKILIFDYYLQIQMHQSF